MQKQGDKHREIKINVKEREIEKGGVKGGRETSDLKTRVGDRS